MPLDPTKDPSPTRTYVAMCNASRFNRYYFRKFALPETCPSLVGLQREEEKLENSIHAASWYFLNHLDLSACLEQVMTYEDFCDLKEA
jgi:hypothetical protein